MPPLTRIREVSGSDDAGGWAPITGLSHIQLLVSDVAASAQWYSAVLGLRPFADDPAIGYVALQHPGAKFVVVLTKAPGGRERALGPANVGIDQAGVVLEGGHPSLQLRDPDGIAIELVAP
jgi:catechol 2,3-dioxygenase-like lactoylglutathione lyase family enzyme